MKTFAELNFPGRLIAVEGLDGSGKSTQIYLLKRWLEMQNLKVFFSEWNSSELVKSATSKGKKQTLLTPTTFSLIGCAEFTVSRRTRTSRSFSRRTSKCRCSASSTGGRN